MTAPRDVVRRERAARLATEQHMGLLIQRACASACRSSGARSGGPAGHLLARPLGCGPPGTPAGALRRKGRANNKQGRRRGAPPMDGHGRPPAWTIALGSDSACARTIRSSRTERRRTFFSSAARSHEHRRCSQTPQATTTVRAPPVGGARSAFGIARPLRDVREGEAPAPASPTPRPR